MAAILTSDFRIADYYARTLNDSGFSLFTREKVEGFARARRFHNRILDLTLTSQEITGTPLPDPDNTNNGVYYEYIGNYELIGMTTWDSKVEFGMSQTNIYVNGALNNDCYVDEVAIAVLFSEEVTGPVVIRGYAVDLHNMLGDIFEAIASNYAKLSIAQRLLDLSTDLTIARREAIKMSCYYRGTKSFIINYTN